MFNKIKEFINSYVKDSKRNITIESEVVYGDNKLEYALSTDDYMASITILSNLTYDFFSAEIESEKMIMVKTKHFKNVENLFEQIKEDLESFTSLKK